MASIESIRKFIRGNMVVYKRGVSLDDDDDIFKSGFVNSMVALKLVTFIEKEFGVSVDNEELDVATFSSVNRIVQWLRDTV